MRCAERALETRHRLVTLDDGLGAIYEGTRAVRYGTTLRARPRSGDPAVDAGQYLAVADDASKRVTADAANLDDDQRRTAHWWMTRAVNALEEVIKAIPAGADAVPEAAMFSDLGKQVYAREPGRFRGARLTAVLHVYRELRDQMA